MKNLRSFSILLVSLLFFLISSEVQGADLPNVEPVSIIKEDPNKIASEPITKLEISDIGEESVDLKWNKIPGVKYLIQKKEKNGDWEEIKDIESNCIGNGLCKVGNLIPSTEYSFRINSISDQGVASDYSQFPNVTTLNRPAALKNIKIKNIDVDSLNITWEKVASVPFSYADLYMSENDDYYYRIKIINSSVAESGHYTVKDLEPEKQYSFLIKTIHKKNEPASSVELEPITTIKVIIEKPIDAKAVNITKNGAVLTWNITTIRSADYVAGYKIEKYQKNTSQWLLVKDIYHPSIKKYELTNLNSSTEYKYGVVNVYEEDSPISEINFKTLDG